MKTATVHAFPPPPVPLTSADLCRAQTLIEKRAVEDGRASIQNFVNDVGMLAIGAVLDCVQEAVADRHTSNVEDFEDGDSPELGRQRALLTNTYCAVFYDTRARHFGAMTPAMRFEEQARTNGDTVRAQAEEVRKVRSEIGVANRRRDEVLTEVRSCRANHEEFLREFSPKEDEE